MKYPATKLAQDARGIKRLLIRMLVVKFDPQRSQKYWIGYFYKAVIPSAIIKISCQ